MQSKSDKGHANSSDGELKLHTVNIFHWIIKHWYLVLILLAILSCVAFYIASPSSNRDLTLGNFLLVAVVGTIVLSIVIMCSLGILIVCELIAEHFACLIIPRE